MLRHNIERILYYKKILPNEIPKTHKTGSKSITYYKILHLCVICLTSFMQFDIVSMRIS